MLGLALGLAGCTGSEPEPQITSSPPARDPSATPDRRIAPLASKNPTAIASYALAAQIALRYQFNGEYLRLALDDMVRADFDQFRDVLTSSALDTLQDAAEDAGSDASDADTVRALTFVDFTEELEGTGLALRPGTTLVTDQRITKPRYDFVDGTPTIWLTSTGEVLVDSAQGQTTVPYAVRMKLDIDDGDDGLRINAWKATWAFNGDRPSAID